DAQARSRGRVQLLAGDEAAKSPAILRCGIIGPELADFGFSRGAYRTVLGAVVLREVVVLSPKLARQGGRGRHLLQELIRAPQGKGLELSQPKADGCGRGVGGRGWKGGHGFPDAGTVARGVGEDCLKTVTTSLGDPARSHRFAHGDAV